MAQVTRVSRFGFVNAYLVEEDDGLTLIDTMLPRSAGTIQAAAERLGRPIVRIALTHAHGDHIGSLDALAEALPGAEVLISAREARLLDKDKSPDPGEPADAKYRGSYPGTKTAPTRTFSPGDRIGSLDVIGAPGHTPGHVALHLPERETVLTGDALVTLDPYTTLTGPRLVAKAALSDSAQNLATLDRIGETGAKHLLPGHGEPWHGPAEEAVAIARRNGTR